MKWCIVIVGAGNANMDYMASTVLFFYVKKKQGTLEDIDTLERRGSKDGTTLSL